MILIYTDRTRRATQGPLCGRCRASAVLIASVVDTEYSTDLTLNLPRGWRLVEPEALALCPPEILCPDCVERLQLTDADSPQDTAVMPALAGDCENDEIQLPSPGVLARLLRGIIRPPR